MTRSPGLTRAQQDEIITARKGAEGSKWDDKVHPGSGLPYFVLRYKVGEAVVRGKNSIRSISRMFKVSVGFVSKWSRVFQARDTANDYTGHKKFRTSKQVFRSISNRPKIVEHPVQDAIRRLVVDRRKRYEFEGAFRLRAALHLDASPTTINKVLRSEKLLGAPKKRHVNKTYGRFQRSWTLQLVQTDYKTWNAGENQFKSIWMIDDCTRFMLAHRIVTNSSAELVIEMLEEVIDKYGKPDQILSDHGTEFYSVKGGKGKSKLDQFCKQHGIKHVMGRVRHPQTQGKMERTHRTASEEVLSFGNLDTLEEAQETFRKWSIYYNWDRPHQALNYVTPGVAFSAIHDLDLAEMMEL